MTNSAHHLRKLLTDWKVPNGQTVASRRAEVAGIPNHNAESLEFWDAVVDGVRLVENLSLLLSQARLAGKDMTTYERYLPALYTAVFAPATNWSQTNNANTNTIKPHVLDMLEAMGDVLEPYDLEAVSPDRLARIVSLLNEAENLIPSTDLERSEIELILLIQKARQFAQNLDHFGARAMNTLLNDVISQGVHYANETSTDDPERSSKLKGILAQIGIQAGGGSLGALGGNAIAVLLGGG